GRSLHLGAGGARAAVVHHHLRRSGAGQGDAAPGASPVRRVMSRYARRKLINGLALSLATVAAALGLLWLGAILFTLLQHGLAGLEWRLLTETTPPPGSAGGLLNAIFGSLVMTSAAVAIGAPLGILAGTYLAEYSRFTSGPWLGEAIRFINDILL